MSVSFIGERHMIKPRGSEEETYIPILYMPQDIKKDAFEESTNKGQWRKLCIEASVNLLEDTAGHMYALPNQPDNDITDFNIQEVQLNIIHMLASILQYLVNSTSWHTKHMQVFDKQELRNRLERVMMILR